MELNNYFKVIAGCFLVSAIYHMIGLFYPVNTSPAWRNALFAGINVAFAIGMIRRPAYLILPFTILMAQQLYSHGTYFLKLWTTENRIDWISLGVLIILPITFFLLLADRKVRNGK